MSDFEFEFNQQDRDLVLSQTQDTFGLPTDYIRLTIYPTEAINNIVDLPNSDNGIDGKAIFFSSLSESTFDINISPFKENNKFNTISIGGNTDLNDFQIYKNPDGSIYIKPNEIFNKFELPQGDYKIQIDFLNQVKLDTQLLSIPAFLIKQVSTSRKEVRLKILDNNIENNSVIISQLTNQFNNNFLQELSDGEFVENNPPFLQDGVTPNPNYKYQFKHVLNVGNGDHIPIMNYAFDGVTDGKNNQSIILKLYEPLPTNIGNLEMVTIEREVLTTQIQNIFYFSDVPDVFFGDGLVPDEQENWISLENNDIGFQNLNQLTISASIGDIEIDSLISQSQYNYPNLNTDFNHFANHTFFGSAKKKLENFKTKVETIQSYYSEISSSLSADGISLTGDSTFLIQKRKDLFKKINKEFRNFTPYERFLYFDGQTDSTSSAPALKNYADNNPLRQGGNYEELNQSNGFNVVYKNSNLGSGIAGEDINLTNTLYRIQNKPFFNYSGSVYLSFLLKGTNNLKIERKISNNLIDGLIGNGFFLPHDTAHTASILEPTVISSSYKRFIYEASQSYFVPNTINNDMADLNVTTGDFNLGSTKITILTGSIKTGSSAIKDTTNLYPTTVVTQSGVPFKGSVMPAGDLFTLKITSGSALTQSFITDVKVTLKNPTNVLPFDNIYKTTSTEWNNWYTDLLTKAETFDTNNIHSFENNLPLYIQQSSDYQDMKDFLNLQGEQYDLIRNHIDSMGTIHKRGYKKTNSPPDNTLPILLSNMGWQAINPFSGSLTDTLGSYLSGVTSIDDIKNNTWRKTLNNLLYIYKSKGTKNSVRALLNTYGYPPDVLNFQEFGGVTSNGNNDSVFSDEYIGGDSSANVDLFRQTGSFSFNSNTKKLYSYNFNGKRDRTLNLDWWMDDANLNTIEFVYKHVKTTQTQTILKSSGSGAETLWDLRLIPSADGLSSSFEFRLNNSAKGVSAIGSRGFSMSLAYNQMNDGQLWNVMVQRMTGSSAGIGTIEYKLHSALQDDTSITPYTFATMSISGGLVGSSTLGGKGFHANNNWQSSGSRGVSTSSNLFVGEIFSGSLSEIKGWSTALSISKFQHHVLNKFSTVGNTINSHKDELVYHFKLNENYTTSSVSASNQMLTFVDSSPTTTYSNYSIPKSGSFFTSSIIYGFDFIDVFKLTLIDNGANSNDNSIIINPNQSIIGNLDPIDSAVDSLINPLVKKPQFNTSPKLEIYRSPQTFIDNFILDNLSGFNLETLYGNPINYYSQSYDEFNTFREDFFDAHPITVDTNKFIRAHENMFNSSIIEGVKSIAPARSTFSDKNSNVGVEIKPTILEKQKYQNEKHSVEVNPNTGMGSHSIDVKLSDNLFGKEILSIYDSVKEGTAQGAPTTIGSFEAPHTASISLGNSYVINSNYVDSPFLQANGVVTTIENPLSASISPLPTYNGSGVETSKDGTFDYASDANKSYVDVHKNWGTSSADVQHINFAAETGSYGTFNTYAIETRFVFHSIGDSEYYSSSFNKGGSDFTNHNNFYNQFQITNGPAGNVNYEHLVAAASVSNTKHQTGKLRFNNGLRMGKTRFMREVISLNGTTGNNQLVLPRNHVTNFSQPFKEQMINGSQNTNPGRLNVRYEDYSTASFYRVTVTGGENQLIVKGGSGDIGGDDKIIYGP